MKDNLNNNIILEANVCYNSKKYDSKIKIFANKITIEEYKGIIIKKYKITNTIFNDDILMKNEEVSIKTKGKSLTFATKTKIFNFGCNSKKEAEKLKEEIIFFKTGERYIKRTTNKIKKVAKGIAGATVAVGGVIATVGATAKQINKNKKEIVEIAKTVKDIVKR